MTGRDNKGRGGESRMYEGKKQKNTEEENYMKHEKTRKKIKYLPGQEKGHPTLKKNRKEWWDKRGGGKDQERVLEPQYEIFLL